MKFWKKKKSEPERTIIENINRSIGHVYLNVAEGLSDTRMIEISAWSAADAFDLFCKVKEKLNEPKRKAI